MDAYTLPELSRLAGVSPRTVRYYIAQGLLRSPGRSGPGARYDDGHLDRLRSIRRLQREHLPLAEIRTRLAALSDADVRRLVEIAPEPSDTASDYIRSVLEGHGATGTRDSRSPSGRAVARPASLVADARLASLPALERGPASGPAPPSALASMSFDPRRPGSSSSLQPPVVGGSANVDAGPLTTGPADRSQWERIALTPDIELHIRRPLSRLLNKRVDRLIAVARDILEG